MTCPSIESAARGWCPSLLTPMESGDGLLVRVKPRAATLAAAQAEAVAQAARRYGNGMIEPTNRGHLQVRGLTDGTVDGFAAAMAGIGLAAAQPEAEAVRNVLADPLGPDDPAARFDSHALARRLSAMLENDPALHALPDKFGLLVDAGVALPLAGCTADIAIRADGDLLTVEPAGGERVVRLPEDAVEDAVRGLLTAFLAWRNGAKDAAATSSARRMKSMVAVCGADAVFEAAGLNGIRLARAVLPRAAEPPPAGFAPVRDAASGYFAIAAPFGSMEADGLAALAGLSRRHADGTIRVTPWKSFVLWGVSPADAFGLQNTAADIGLVADPDDPRRRIVACAGRPRCASGYADTRADAAYLAAAGLPGTGVLHISGCAKGCAHPAPAGTALVATQGGYDLVRNGRAGDAPERTNLTREVAAEALAAPNPVAPIAAVCNTPVPETVGTAAE
ncbi:MAG: precorrin-3B synthase [Rhodospirillaceae bacterium]|nr:precorrin-3B synthase [Rhodospirillaceae bacterium]MYH38734.1 precorrin-3B synthase [Rhodospirillaceae bacterium]MYK12495.1 precorrin-3B synthase [Rhodospirillaceae bacterium]MYK58766.1 precorrin-3B synthase [Rhodospirillaceae bacterium]